MWIILILQFNLCGEAVYIATIDHRERLHSSGLAIAFVREISMDILETASQSRERADWKTDQLVKAGQFGPFFSVSFVWA